MKPIEKMLYEIFLDLTYALETAECYIQDTELELRIMRKARNKTKKLIKQASDHYKSIYGNEPMKHK